jgi:hypothetical protein
MKLVEIPLIRITGEPNITVCCDDFDYQKMLNFIHDYEYVAKNLELKIKELGLYS